MFRKSAVFCILAVVFCIGNPGYPQGAPTPQELAQKLIDDMSNYNESAFWQSAQTLEDLVVKSPNVIDFVLSSAENRPSPYVRLGCARALYTGGKKREAVTVLTQLIKENNDDSIRILTADLGSKLVKDDSGFGTRPEISAKIQDAINASTNLKLKISLCKFNYFISGGVQPWNDLKNILESGDDQSKEDAALALAECGNFEPAMATLRKLAKKPTPEGILAAQFLAKRELDDRMLRQLMPLNDPKYNLLNEIITLIEENYVDPEKVDFKNLVTSAAKGLAGSLDAFTSYLDEKGKKRLEEVIKGKYAGIGAYVSMRDNVLTIEKPIYPGPAAEAGLRSLDKIIEIEGESTLGRDIEDLTAILKGPEGTIATVKVLRKGWVEAREYKIKRARISIKTAKYEVLPGNIGYVQVVSFSENTFNELSEGLKYFQGNNVNAVIIDMRDNGGGLLDAAVNIVDLFVPANTVVVTTKGKNGKVFEIKKTKFDDKLDIPVVVLINSSTASAAEIFSGCMQDYSKQGLLKAVLVGEQSYGKGSVQRPFELQATGGATGMRLTIAKYFLPSGRSIHRDRPVDGSTPSKEGGVNPDIEVKLPEREFWLENVLSKVFDSGEIEKYVKERYEANKDLFKQLAENDGLDTSRYPDFEAVYEKFGVFHVDKNEIHLDRNEIRRLLRTQIRRVVVDDNKHEFIYDMEDVQFQRAILEALKMINTDPESIPTYKVFAHKFDNENTTKKDEPK